MRFVYQVAKCVQVAVAVGWHTSSVTGIGPAIKRLLNWPQRGFRTLPSRERTENLVGEVIDQLRALLSDDDMQTLDRLIAKHGKVGAVAIMIRAINGSGDVLCGTKWPRNGPE